MAESPSTISSTFLKSAQKLFKILMMDRADIGAIYFFAILSGLISLTLPLGIQTIISFVQAGALSTSIVVLIVIVVGGVYLNGLVLVRQQQIIEKVEQKIFTRYGLEFSDKLPKLNIEKFDSYYLPELVNRFFDTLNLTKGIEKILLDIPTASIQILFGLILLSFYHPIFIAFGALLIIIVAFILRFTSPKGLETSMKASDYKYGLVAWLEEMARVIKTFKYSKGTSLHMEKTDLLIQKYLESRTNHFRILITQYWSFIAFKFVITGAMLIVGTYLLINQQINVGEFVAADIVIITIISSVEKLISSMDKVYDSLTSVYKLSKVVESENEQGGTLLLDENAQGLSISFNDVSFKYSNTDQVLSNISFQVLAGQKVGIKGLSGAGKTSLLKLLTGAYKNFTGSILVNDVPIDNYNLDSIRSQTGVLLSQQNIFEGTLLENITLGNKAIALSEVTALAQRVGLSEFIQSHKFGFDTHLDPLGKHLNTQVRQNILLMRALLGHHRLLLLEDPVAHLIGDSKKDVFNLIKNDLATALITTNDNEILEKCDYVITLEAGKIVAKDK